MLIAQETVSNNDPSESAIVDSRICLDILILITVKFVNRTDRPEKRVNLDLT